MGREKALAEIPNLRRKLSRSGSIREYLEYNKVVMFSNILGKDSVGEYGRNAVVQSSGSLTRNTAGQREKSDCRCSSEIRDNG